LFHILVEVDIEPVQQSLFTKLQRHEKWAAVMVSLEGILTLLLLANIIYLNIYLFNRGLLPKPSDTSHVQSPVVSITPSPITQPTRQTTLSPATPSKTQPPAQTFVPRTVKDYYISLGSGASDANTWTDVPGVQAVIDFGQYPHVKEIHFEISLYIPTANEWVSVRLYNETDKHPVWNSQVTTDPATTAYLTSPALSYDTGAKLYQVQMETQLQAPTTLVQSRIHIILQ